MVIGCSQFISTEKLPFLCWGDTLTGVLNRFIILDLKELCYIKVYLVLIWYPSCVILIVTSNILSALVSVVSSSPIPQWLVTFINLSKFSEKMGYSSIGCSTQVLVLLVDVLAMVCCLPSLFRCSSCKDDVELRVLMESHCKIFCLLSLWLFYHLFE